MMAASFNHIMMENASLRTQNATLIGQVQPLIENTRPQVVQQQDNTLQSATMLIQAVVPTMVQQSVDNTVYNAMGALLNRPQISALINPPAIPARASEPRYRSNSGHRPTRENFTRRGGSYQNQSYRHRGQNPNNHYHQGSVYHGRRGLPHSFSSTMRRSRSRSPPSGPRADSSRRSMIERVDVDPSESIIRTDESLLGRLARNVQSDSDSEWEDNYVRGEDDQTPLPKSNDKSSETAETTDKSKQIVSKNATDNPWKN